MKKFNKIFMSLGVAALSLGFTSCVGDLDLQPINPSDMTDVSGNMDQVFADIFLNFSSDGVNGDSPVKDFDGGMSNFSRAMFTAECMPTDEASWLWDPEKFGDLKYGKVTPSVPCVYGFYSRMIINITLCNQFIQCVENGTFNLDAAGKKRSEDYVRQAKIMRSLCYYYMLSFYDKIPYADESTSVGALPPQLSRAEVYQNVTSTLEGIVSYYLQNEPNQVPVYGYVGLDAAESILAKIYLNGEVFAGRNDYANCYKHCKNIIDRLGHGGYYGNGLARSYNTLFGYNNDQYVLGNGGNDVNEIILAYVNNDVRLKAWGGATFLIAGWIGNIDDSVVITAGRPTQKAELDGEKFEIEPGVYGVYKYYADKDDFAAAAKAYEGLESWEKQIAEEFNGDYYSLNPNTACLTPQWFNVSKGWKCMVTRKSFVKLFNWEDPAMSVSNDRRVCNWQTSSHHFAVDNISLLGDDFGRNGYLALKYTNWAYNEDGTINQLLSPTPTEQVGGDCVGIRLAEIYLTAAEAILNGGGGSQTEALDYVNYIRVRAFNGDESVKWTSLNMQDLRDERARELYQENVRRTDLIRWNQWTSGYTWEWKGGIQSGTNLPEYTKLYPIPMRVMISSDFKQTTGY